MSFMDLKGKRSILDLLLQNCDGFVTGSLTGKTQRKPITRSQNEVRDHLVWDELKYTSL